MNCKSIHREIPPYLLPYKHYEKEVIQGVLEGFINNHILGFEDYPCDATMERWRNAKKTSPLMKEYSLW